MTTPITFRRPRITIRRSPTFGLPRGTFGRGAYEPQAIILHSLRTSLESYDAQETGTFFRDKAELRHPSLHYAIDYQGNIHQYVEDADIAWGMWDYSMSNFPTPFTPGDWEFLTTYPDVSPDYYALHIGAMSGEIGDFTPFSQAALLAHARLIAWLCHTYGIECDETHVVTHETIDLQFVGSCIGDVTYPYADILALAQEIIDAGGEPDPIFDPAPIVAELYGPFTVGVSRVSSAAYISND